MKSYFACAAAIFVLVAMFAVSAPAQQPSARAEDKVGIRAPRVLVTGDAVVQAQPDTAMLTVSVVTQSKSALAAQQENARRSERVVGALKEAAGPGAEIKTSGYVLTPQRVYKENQPPTITGYEARNSVTVTLADLTSVGRVIDAATEAGANNVENVSFTLRKERAALEQSLRDATAEALGKAQAIAQSLGKRIVRIVEVREEGTIRPRPVYAMESADIGRVRAAASTPIEIGTLDVRSQVQLTVEITD